MPGYEAEIKPCLPGLERIEEHLFPHCVIDRFNIADRRRHHQSVRHRSFRGELSSRAFEMGPALPTTQRQQLRPPRIHLAPRYSYKYSFIYRCVDLCRPQNIHRNGHNRDALGLFR